ncbi:low temperature requirement protein A [Solicola gregarius]|uniref:Low temperature requirement protein A n=1 Tax=Solicola gregarius TaxID=2908642 RepID=A0AA46YIW0_9ACTN|nr:low temperature requirement protein A [Solicola gregarius]UYM03387.1 low temperature requirement protein A [Solicola gregarius]
MQERRLRLVRPVRPRDPDEEHRVATPLELFTDLCFVVAIAQAAASFHHEISHGHILEGALFFAMAFWAIFWAWLNFTWFASAYDNDDVTYRCLTLLQIAGSLVLAAGISQSFDGDFTLVVVGYVIMRVALVVQWVRAGRNDPDHRTTAYRYAVGIVIMQCFWIAFLFFPESIALPAFVLFAIGEMAVPAIAERAGGTPWHPEHVAERYSLFFIIVLGETILSSTVAIQESIDAGNAASELTEVIVGGILIVFSLWWLYFSRGDAEVLRGRSDAANMTWGFGHYFIFASAAAIGAGLAARVDYYTDHSESGGIETAYVLAVPVAVLLCGLYVLRLRQHDPSWRTAAPLFVAAAAVLVAALTPVPEVVIGLILAAAVAAELLNPAGVGEQYVDG